MTASRPPITFENVSQADVLAAFDRTDYVATDEIVTTIYLALRLGKPLLVEGEPGSGKTELGKVLADGFNTDLVRLQCYEGLTAEHTLYEWNYTKQLLDVQARVSNRPADDSDGNSDATSVFDQEYLLERPLLRAVTHEGERSPVLLVDEIDRADEEFEALLLEFLSDFQITIPELGTIKADRRPIVIITSNRTRGLSDALKRRCLYLNLGLPSAEREREIVRTKVPELSEVVTTQLCRVAQQLRTEPVRKIPGVAETLDWAQAIGELRAEDDGDLLSERELRATLGCLLKEADDIARVDDDLIADLLAAAEGESTGIEDAEGSDSEAEE